VDMGRNIFQSDSPLGMLRAVRGVVHDGLTPEQALDLYQSVRAGEQTRVLAGAAR
jgi:3-hydroxy-5-phosphonooxypentane-2,4-dione thiolase